ncbi:NAD(P)/FAD-dependent oxidoreductase [Haloarcula onubensis]|uniref:NAD(P)/FAD-dependent oxidoreductase n=1 Tax=Haloarcula onubensis TaxID=2950539 RepID=A0ABU2FKV2_9EURY|nr:NAD(P)/FAD-dependent oxidoreductase [Halomicroarcula sp. S3CR25-11]MDS0281385.1 NAD(P)/FAD-dependent oxidoreductase [Halomicroarcula sp. S3CR25-11]
MEDVDVAIVGGGPAGSSAAEAAAARGADTVVLEKGVPRADRDGPGPDSTDAAGLLDYWLDIMEYAPDEIPEDIVLSELDGAKFYGPSSELSLTETGIDASYDGFGFTFHRARFDDWLRERAEDAGADYRVGVSVTGVDTELAASPRHTLELAGGEDIRTDYVVLADGPQRTVTGPTLDQFLLDRTMGEIMPSNEVNHIAYQEHRRMPAELFDPDFIEFWWGMMPGHTAYPWIFPNDDHVARIGLTMPIGLDIDDFEKDEWALLRPDDDGIPRGTQYIERLLERQFPGYDLADFPIVEDRGKSKGTETYPISSTRPIESPASAGIAVTGGAMGATSAFHEGGDHVAVRTGKIAGRLAAEESLERYNREWHAAIGDEILRNVTFADMVRDWRPRDWDRAFRTAKDLMDARGIKADAALRGGLEGLKLVVQYKWGKFGYRDGRYVQLREADYAI